MRCPHCATDINDRVPECPQCHFHIRQLDEIFGAPPQRDGPVVDTAAILSEDGKRKLAERCKAFREKTGAELCVVTVKDSAPRLPTEHVFWLFNRWQIGGEGHAGILILVSLAERRIESEVGIALETIVTDEASTLILKHHAVPFFALGKFDEGLFHACDVLAQMVEKVQMAVPEPGKK